jgi:hypothetical protein
MNYNLRITILLSILITDPVGNISDFLMRSNMSHLIVDPG